MIAGGRSWLDPGPLKQTARDEQLGSHLHHHSIEPGCTTRHPRHTFRLAAQRCGPTGAGCLITHQRHPGRSAAQIRDRANQSSAVIPGLRSRTRDPEPPTRHNEARRHSHCSETPCLWIPACAGMTVELQAPHPVPACGMTAGRFTLLLRSPFRPKTIAFAPRHC